MRGLKIYTSNRLEILVECLAEVVVNPLASPLKPEIIVIQSRGMERWISMEIARRHGICANIQFPFPNVFLEDMFRILIPDLPQESPFEPGVLTFHILKTLPKCINRPGYKSLKTFLFDDPQKRKLFQLSEKIADLFDQYLVFRPEMIFSWDSGEAHHWQAELWREISKGTQKLHRAQLRKVFLEKIATLKQATETVQRRPPSGTRSSQITEALPERVSVFGISYLPRFHMEAFTAISNVIRVNLFLMNPCRVYWGDIVTDKERKRIKKVIAGTGNSDEALYLEKGNRLLASMGMLGRDFFDFICSLDFDTFEKFEEPPRKNLLSCIQSDILNLADRGTCSSSVDHFTVQKSDTSIQIHSCHSRMREIEILYDNLLGIFDEIEDLQPKDIVVMTPDIESYEPFIHAVFGVQEDDASRIPYSVSDLNAIKESRLISGFLNILDLKDSRFSVSQVLGVLESPGVKEKFGLTEADIETAENWIKETQIRWGIDAQNRLKFGIPGFAENTWKAGIERLLLGYAMPGGEKKMFSGVLPFDNIEGSEATCLGRFLEFLDKLFSVSELLNKPRDFNGWTEFLNQILEQFFLADERSEHEIQILKHSLNEMSRIAELSGYDDKIEFEGIRTYLSYHLERTYFGSGFISGGVTFCAMLPMRSIPFRVICLLGMNGDAFPRDAKPLGFDLIAGNPRPGDRSRRNDDKYLFLEAILSARDTLYISYIGQSIQDNTPIPPSVLVSELIDYVREGFGVFQEDLMRRHRLQGFSQDYFKSDSRYFSYSKENFSVSGRLHDRKHILPFISEKLSEPPEEWKLLEPVTLCDFFSHPSKFLLQKRLGIYFEEPGSIVPEDENFGLSPLEKYQIGQDLVSSKLSGLDLKEVSPIQKAKGLLPHGNVGEVAYGEMRTEAEIFVNKIESYLKDKLRDFIDIDYEVAGFRFIGRLADIVDQKIIRIRYADTKPKDLLYTWICHLLLTALPDKQYSQNTTLICKDAVWEFYPVSDAEEILKNLLCLFWQGLREPVHFFPESSYEYAKQSFAKLKLPHEAVKAARNKWAGSDFHRGESQDPYYDLCFRKIDPFDDSFQKIAKTVFNPLLANSTEVKNN